MDSEPVVGAVVAAVDAFVVANNEVRDRGSAHEYLRYGADAVSVGRPSTDPRVLRRVAGAVRAWFEAGPADDDRPVPAEPDARHEPGRHGDGGGGVVR